MNRFCSVFQQILKLIPRDEFEKLVREGGAERGAKGFRCWDQLVAMLFCQFARAQSLREIQQGLASSEGKLSHLGVKKAPVRSTLSYANKHRPWQLFEATFRLFYQKCAGTLGRHDLKLAGKLFSLDATVIPLCVKMFPWAKYQRIKGAVKLHLLLDHDGHLPSYAVITDGNTADLKVARELHFPEDSVIVFDRGYNDHLWFAELNVNGVGFVTRMKSDTRYELINDLPIHHDWVLSDTRVRLEVEELKKIDGSGLEVRRLEWVDEDGEVFVFLTNRFDLEAETVAEIYRQRWQIELFFKALKQNLRIKTFIGTSENALHIQVWTALISILILKFLQLRARFGWSLSNLVAMIRLNLFTYRDLFRWLDEPFTPPDVPPDPVQLELLPGQQKGGLILR